MDKQHLVLGVMDDPVERRFERRHVGRGQLALEDRVLNVIAELPAGLKNPAQAFIVGDVIADEIGGANGEPPDLVFGLVSLLIGGFERER